MSTVTRAVAGVSPVTMVVLPREEPVELATWPQAQWQPRLRGALAASPLDGEAPAAELTPGDALLVRLGGLVPGDVGRVAVRVRAIEWYLPMAVYLARRFSGRGEALADLTQVAVIGLIKAVDRFDANRGVLFASYAIPTIVGELKRHFRDSAWNIRVPRRLQELKLELATVTEDLGHVLQRSPTTAELAVGLGVGQHDVLDARRSANAYHPLSFERAAPGSEDLRLIDRLGAPDPGLKAVDDRETLRAGLAGLSARERRVITLRFFTDMTQVQIAAEIGVSQMHVSRLLTRSLMLLRDGMLADSATVATVAAAPAGVRRQVIHAAGPDSLSHRR